MERGDLIRVEWEDIQENVIADTTRAEPAIRTSFGLFWEEKIIRDRQYLVTTTTIDRSSTDQSGFCCYPMGCVLSIHVEKKRGRRKKKEDVRPGPVSSPS